jgi:hypothetical protein
LTSLTVSRIFTNLYLKHDPGIKGAEKRGDWWRTKFVLNNLGAMLTRTGTFF